MQFQSIARWIWVTSLYTALAGCASVAPQTNFPGTDLPSPSSALLDNRKGYEFGALASNAQSPDIFVILAMSGGGKRSAAFSYGVLKGLRDTTLVIDGRQQSLLSKIHIISSVSGSSFTAAYYGLHREKIFKNYEQDFLKRDIEAYIYGTLLLPWNWSWMFASARGTNDRMAEVYDRFMFHGATYADLYRKGQPLILLNATEVSYGAPFTFTRSSFDTICSDLSKYKIARAVAASNGFPVILTPITLTSYLKKCPNLQKAMSATLRPDGFTRIAILDRIRANYIDPNKTWYLHLMDGGIADNLALRGILNTMIGFRRGSAAEQNEQLRALLPVRRILVILADGQAINDGNQARRPTVSGLRQIFNAVTNTQIDQYNYETMLLAKREFEDLAARLRTLRCRTGRRFGGHRCDDVTTFLVRISLSDVRDTALRKRLQSIRTGLTIKSQDVDALVAAGRHAILASKTIKRFVESAKGSR
jgi:NTE family protein